MKRLPFILILLMVTVFKSYAQQPSFKGGNTAFDDFLRMNIIYPEYSSRNCIAGVIQVRFRVDEAGRVSDVAVQKGLGIDLDDEAVRVVKLTSGKWNVPAGYNPNFNIVLPIRFTPDYSKCLGAVDINTAITNYRAQQELENAVTNYYKNKYAGKADAAKENEVIALKKQLGYDDEFIDDLLQKASHKLKQGDKAGACEDWNFIRNIGSNKADSYLAKYCK